MYRKDVSTEKAVCKVLIAQCLSLDVHIFFPQKCAVRHVMFQTGV